MKVGDRVLYRLHRETAGPMREFHAVVVSVTAKRVTIRIDGEITPRPVKAERLRLR